MRKTVLSHRRAISILFSLLFVLVLAGCSKKQIQPGVLDEADQHQANLKKTAEATSQPTDLYYQLVPGDTIEITYFIRPNASNSKDYIYKFDIGDELTVEFLYDKTFNFTRMVRPDGRISVPAKGDVVVLGKTPDWLCAQVHEIFTKVLQNSECSVSVTKVGRKENELKEAITTQQGRQKEITVRPDGFLSFPIVNEVFAEGKTIPQLYEEINRLYQKEYPTLETSIQLKSLSSMGIYVAGEVARPGNYPTFKAVTPIQAIALAGGILPTANLKKVIVITADKDRKPVRHIVDVQKMLTKGEFDSDIMVGYNTIVYVPKTFVAAGDQFVEQYINKLLMFQGYSVGATYLLNGTDYNNDNNK